VVLALAGATAATADNYGTTPAVQARMTRLIHRYFDPTGYGDTMVRCAARESGFNPRAVNWAGPVFGLLQIRYGVWSHPWESLMHFAYRMWNPRNNLRLGLQILRRQGIAAWNGGC
jgi:hypothetical protein